MVGTVQLKAEFQEQNSSGGVYVLSMAWFREWENFVCCKTNGLLNSAPCQWWVSSLMVIVVSYTVESWNRFYLTSTLIIYKAWDW